MLQNAFSGFEPALIGQNFNFMTHLLKSKISEATALEIVESVRQSRKHGIPTVTRFPGTSLTDCLAFAGALCVLYLMMIFMCYFFMLLGIRMADERTWENVFSQFLAVAGMCLCPCTAMVISSWLLFIKVPCMVVTDHIRMSARQIALVDPTRATKVDWNGCMSTVYRAHESTVRLGRVLAPALTVTQAVLALAALWFVICGITPRDTIDVASGPGAALTLFFPSQVFYLFSSVMTIGALWPMFGPAEMTLACDELMAAVHGLKMGVGEVSFQWKNPDFLLRNPDLLIRNPDFRLKNVDFII